MRDDGTIKIGSPLRQQAPKLNDQLTKSPSGLGVLRKLRLEAASALSNSKHHIATDGSIVQTESAAKRQDRLSSQLTQFQQNAAAKQSKNLRNRKIKADENWDSKKDELDLFGNKFEREAAQ